MDSRILVAAEVAELLRVSEQRVYELARTGKIPTIRLGARQYRFSERAITEWAERGGNSPRRETYDG